MEKRIFFDNPRTGGVSVIIPAYRDLARSPDDTDEALLARCMAECEFPNVVFHIVDETVIPVKDRFRDAWVIVDDKIVIDPIKRADIVERDFHGGYPRDA